MLTAICDAIHTRRLLMFAYGDSVRVVEPHLYGVNSAGHEALRAWLRPGLSRSDPRGGWRMHLAAEMRELQVLDERFAGRRAGSVPDDGQMRYVHCQLVADAADVADVVDVAPARDGTDADGAA